jgi:hypothetical protein
MADELSAFDPALFLNQSTDQVFDTKYTLLPDGDYKAMVDKLAARRTGDGQIVLDIFWNLLDCDDLKAKLGLEKAIVKQGLFLDYEDGQLASGPNKNVKLGKVRAALKQDKKGQPWNFNKMLGAGPVTVHVGTNGDYNNVDRVAS